MISSPDQLRTIMEVLQIEELTAEEREEVLLDLNDMVFEGTVFRLIERMDEASRDQFSQLMDAGTDEEELEAFLKERVPDADSAVAEAVKELTDDILAATGT